MSSRPSSSNAWAEAKYRVTEYRSDAGPGSALVNVSRVAAEITEPWSPRTLAAVNDYAVRVFRAHGAFERHRHSESDELFLVLEGELTLRVDDGDVVIHAGELFVVPRGVYHQPVSEGGASVLLLEPASVVKTGD